MRSVGSAIAGLSGLLGLLGLLLGASAAGGLGVAPTSVPVPSPPGPSLQMRVVEGSPLPAGCDLGRAAGVVTGFVDAFNRGDQAALATFFPAATIGNEPVGPGRMGWFAVTGAEGGFNPGFIAWSRKDLLPYLAERHAKHERLRLLQIQVAGSLDGVVNMGFDVARQADDIPAHVAGGKGALDCGARTIVVWNLGDRESLQDFINPPPVPTCPADMPRCE